MPKTVFPFFFTALITGLRSSVIRNPAIPETLWFIASAPALSSGAN